MPEAYDVLPRPDGNQLAYCRLCGTAPGVVFLGGFKSDMTGTKAQALEQWCRTQGRAFVRFDYFGHGRSSGDFTDGTIGHWRADVLAVLDKLTSGPQVLVGSSMGGWLMLLAALARPQRVAALLGIAAAADFTEDLIRSRLTAPMQLALAQTGQISVPSDYDPDPYPITRRLLDEGREHLLLRDSHLAIDCPVRLLHGMEDVDVPWSTSVRISDQLASDNVRITLVKDGDHRLSRCQDLGLIQSILAELAASAATPA